MSNSVGGCDLVEGSTSKKRSRERSEVWIHFDKTPDNKNAICKYCGTSMVAESKKGTSHLKRHIEKKHQQDVDQPVTMGIRDEVRKFGWTNKRNWEVEVMKAIIAEVPFAPSDCKKVYSRLMGSKHLDKEIGLYYEQEKEKLANEFKHLTSRVCFGYEIMEEEEPNLNYISITAHFINEYFNLVNKLIGFKKLTDSSKSCVVHTIVKCISDWELGDKIYSFTGKDHSEYVRSLKEDFSPIMSLDGPYFHLPCYKKGLTSFYSDSQFLLCSDLFWNLMQPLTAVRCHMDAFNEIAKERGLPPINKDWLNQHAESYFDLACLDRGRREHAVKILKEATLYKDVIGNCSKGHDIDWERVEVVAKFSEKVREIIDAMASFNYPTLNLYFRDHAEIEDILSRKEDFAITIKDWSDNPFWDRSFYCKENKIIFVACALDPRYKLRFLNYYSENIAKRNRPDFTKEVTDEICEFLEDFFGEYKGKTTELPNPQEGCTSNSAHLNPIIDGFSMYTKELKKKAPKSELEEYLNDTLVDLDDASFNLLDWWKHNRLRYPVLSKMARDVLAVPTSVYSIKGNMIAGLRAFEGVSPQLVEAVICSKDWIFTDVQRLQGISIMCNSVGGGDHVEGSTSKKRSRERRSEVWIHFDKTPDNKKAICKFCGRSMVAESKNGTSHLKRHIKACKKHQQDVDQPVTMGILDEVRKYGWTNKRNWEVEVMKAIIAEVPFAHSYYKKVYSRLMGSIDLDKEIGLYYEQEKEKLANEFKHLTSGVCFSYEIMEEEEEEEEEEPNLKYISITAHFINEDFNLVNKLIGFKKLTDSSKSCVVYTIVKCISDWELGDKIFSFTGKDYSEYMRSLKEYLSPIMSLDGPYFQLPCYKKGLTSFYSGSQFRLCCDLCWNLMQSMTAVRCHMDAFNEIAKERGLPPVNEDWLNQHAESYLDLACLDRGRREHAVKMLKEATVYKDVIGNCSKRHDIDWERVEVVVKLSDKVCEIIDTMASFNYPTFNLYFRDHAEIEDILSRKEDFAITIKDWSDDPFWDRSFYCKENKIIFVACALDPRYKLRFLNYYSENIAKRNRPEFTKEVTDEICEFLEDFFGSYKEKTTELSNPQEGCTSNSAHLNPIIDGFSMYTKELKKKAPKSELEEYLNDTLVDLDDASFNLLDWWKHNRLRYPVLSKMARDVLAVPTSVYSIKGNMIADLRAFEGVSPQLVEAVICSKDWIFTNVQRCTVRNLL